MAWGASENDRRNIISIGMMVPLALVPDGTIDSDDQENFLYLPIVFNYSGTIPPIKRRRRGGMWLNSSFRTLSFR